MKQMKINVAGQESVFDYNKIAHNTQEELVSGENLKTVNEENLLGSGDVPIEAGEGKLDKVETQTQRTQVYAKTPDGDQLMLDTDDSATPNTLVRRDANNNFRCGRTQHDWDAVPKIEMNEAIANAITNTLNQEV